ncbi:hypothetical protein CLG94_01055 [Candidatus Methylomirabilis limnetica]|uniref:DUF559 domain-containing protein n=1 Tax=Candidatus Methylomirabilis limnetica TaxID=2033718 RepID=A0A2T4U1B3_9BACT|nr:DUF559 domain-containing protein [Candidatus Methylomirabilis limnetica]PTL37150.1 hypothetical protein CLG94_01055 [Candidatus Methylomirabilis limnetica]
MGGVGRKARTPRKRPTDTESALWRQLRLRRIEGRKFHRQHPIGPLGLRASGTEWFSSGITPPTLILPLKGGGDP